VIFFQFALFLFIGVLLFVHYSDNLTTPQQTDSIYPRFVWDNLPAGAAGIVIAAILAAGMSNLSAALNSLSSTTVMDFYKPLAMRRNWRQSDAHFLGVARWVTVLWGVVLFLVGLVARQVGSVLEAGLTIASILYGSLLGVFLLGILTKRVQQNAAMIAMIAGLLLMIYVRFETRIAFTWYVVIGTAATFSTGYMVSLFLKEPPYGRTSGNQ
jgi:Na+/proline symporter